ncbi:hypothetical protein XBFFL1_1990018 [Xenorhabdus bovienii str. feltiae Florida]|uniref:Uncharacterized protein n=2 Tax=Xenorhabdus bovienii TaxID=40576 RepID=A0A0B6XGM3_XENBV|nr:hypothetical protein XBFFR1_2620019 [Xenorhabdus bovienii str. feltiae France]CDG92116.1 hypothetical protein XBFFL1_1990018 [Xenorhabdus bovienii str. feltiae Florida]CDH00922.1 hypothetical protein XBFM1_1910078 [Xenorhabdus bovienii str. feltiae Moldova]CDM92049.1 protein of unknown function [Xenorhabdus bovienii]
MRAYTTPPLRILGLARRAYLSKFFYWDNVSLFSDENVLRWAPKPDEAVIPNIKLELI